MNGGEITMDYLNLRSRGYVEIENEIWFPNFNFNALVKLEKSSGKIRVIDRFPNFSIEKRSLYSTVCHVKDWLVFVPYNSDEIVSYNIRTKEFVSALLDQKYVGERREYFLSAYVHDRSVYMFPMAAKCLVRYDVYDRSAVYLTDPYIDSIPETSFCFGQEFEVVDKKVYLPFLNVNAVAVLDVQKERLDIRNLQFGEGCSTINYGGGFFYLASTGKGELYRWEMGTGDVEIYHFPKELEAVEYAFLCSCRREDKLLFFPDMGNMVVSFDIRSGKMREERRINEPTITFFIKENVILMEHMNHLCSFSYSAGKLSFAPYLQMDDPYNREEILRFLLQEGYFGVLTEEDISLEDYVKVLKRMDSKQKADRKDSYGNVIWNKSLESGA